ncbi:MAG: hypothetical protein RIQ64_1716, partial [Actinomycetota bacterium]
TRTRAIDVVEGEAREFTEDPDAGAEALGCEALHATDFSWKNVVQPVDCDVGNLCRYLWHANPPIAVAGV